MIAGPSFRSRENAAGGEVGNGWFTCFLLGFASILGSIAIGYLTGGTDPQAKGHAERFGIFVGLWAPTFLHSV